MSSLHQVASAKDGESFMAIGLVTVHKVFNPKVSKNDRPFCSVILKSAGNELFLTLWDEAARWKIPLGDTTLRGKFTKNTFNGKPSLSCEEIVTPEGAEEWKPEDIQEAVGKPSMKDCLDAGLRAADYIGRKEHPEFAQAAFAFGCQAFLQGIRLE